MPKHRKYIFKPGEVIGQLTVIRDSQIADEKRRYWVECRCSCGIETKKQVSDLTRARARNFNIACKECPARTRRKSSSPTQWKRKYIFKPGDVIGQLTVIKDSGIPDKRGVHWVECRCSCGAETKRYATHLAKNPHSACTKCLTDIRIKQNKSRARIINIGEKFNAWTIIGTPSDFSGDSQYHIYQTQCLCGKKSEFPKKDLVKATCCMSCAKLKNRPKVGDVFGKFTIIDIIKIKKDNSCFVLFKCQCVCGNQPNKLLKDLRERGHAGCIKCCHLKICSICGCKGGFHKYIDLETSECEMIGFCELCDRFKLNKYIYTPSLNRVLVFLKSRNKAKRMSYLRS